MCVCVFFLFFFKDFLDGTLFLFVVPCVCGFFFFEVQLRRNSVNTLTGSFSMI